MLLADGIILVVGGLFVIGLLGFFAAAVVVVAKFLGFLFRAMTRAPANRAKATLQMPDSGHVECPAHRCGHVNPAGARYCARCGRPLGPRDDVDAYG